MDRSTPQSWTEKVLYFEKLVAKVSLYGHKERVALISVIGDGDDVCVEKRMMVIVFAVCGAFA